MRREVEEAREVRVDGIIKDLEGHARDFGLSLVDQKPLKDFRKITLWLCGGGNSSEGFIPAYFGITGR